MAQRLEEPNSERRFKMEEAQKKLVKDTWASVVPIADKAAELFYGKLFEMDPPVERLFKGDMKEQGAKLMKTITVAVNSLDRMDQLIPIVQDLGRRHVGYGVKAEHYATVGGALLWTLEKGLGEAFTPEVKEAWTITYETLAGVMQDAAADVA
jgi:hemoglobin-like flavoprotein